MSKYNWDIEKIKIAVLNSINLSETLEKLEIPIQGNNGKTLKNIMIKNNIDFSHFTGRARVYRNPKKANINNYLTNKSKVSTHLLKRLLFKEGYKENKCENCGISEWNNKPLTCQLHHINGNHLDNRLENLQILCPNCHSQTNNYCGNSNKIDKVIKVCPDCGKPIKRTSTRCTICANKYKRKVERPSKDLLIKDIKNMSICAIGRKYKVSDNTIRKWIKNYNINI